MRRTLLLAGATRILSLRRDAAVDSLVDLNRALTAERNDIRTLRAPADHHFGPAGNRWIRDRIPAQVPL